MKVRDIWPRRSDGLPPGQREAAAFPRFSDDPFRPPPPTAPIELVISNEGQDLRTLTSVDLSSFDSIEITADFHCVTTWSHRNLRWGGVRFVDVMSEIFDGAPPPFMLATAADGMTAKYRTDDLVGPDVILATHLDGEPLEERHGAPLRLVSPQQYGYKSAKHLVRLDFCVTEPRANLGPKEHLRARVAEEERHGARPNWMLRLPYRFVVVPTALAAERTLRKTLAQRS